MQPGKVRSIKTPMSEFDVEKVSSLSLNLNQTDHLWDELEWTLRDRSSFAISVPNLTIALEEWSKVPVHTPKTSCGQPSQKNESCFNCKGLANFILNCTGEKLECN